MTDGTTFERLKKIIVEQLGVDEEEVTPHGLVRRGPQRRLARPGRAHHEPRRGVRDGDLRRGCREDPEGLRRRRVHRGASAVARSPMDAPLRWTSSASASASIRADPELIRQAFVHSSFLNENPTAVSGHNERLEFYGDAVIGLDRQPPPVRPLSRRGRGLPHRAPRRPRQPRGAGRAWPSRSASTATCGSAAASPTAGGATRPSRPGRRFEALAGALVPERGTRRAPSDVLAPTLRAAARGPGRDRGAAEVREVAAPGVDPAAPRREADLPARPAQRARRTSSTSRRRRRSTASASASARARAGSEPRSRPPSAALGALRRRTTSRRAS